jgi:enamine deaminase RidA (YjgF/YER057c/UK114 family)
LGLLPPLGSAGDRVGVRGLFNRAYKQYFEAIRPTRTTVGVVALPIPISVELKIIAES